MICSQTLFPQHCQLKYTMLTMLQRYWIILFFCNFLLQTDTFIIICANDLFLTIYLHEAIMQLSTRYVMVINDLID